MTWLSTRVVPVLRAVIGTAFLAVLVLMLLSFPGALRDSEDRGVLLFVVEAELLCVQVVLVSTWRLLGMVAADRIFSDDAFRWVDAILGAIVVGWLVWVGFGVLVLVGSDDPGTPIAVAVVGLGITVVGLLMVVMRALLRQATTLQTDMDAVI
ncbi:DUF2975 domain-containing protein [Nocardioides aestuarii]|uniref:DUF2975 domain-containing protein n=1 Tax=Nocardioides aestuarii TaxID=252231 RepID=A0ABW4TN61_9ACTN